MLNQWQPLFTCYLSLTFIRFLRVHQGIKLSTMKYWINYYHLYILTYEPTLLGTRTILLENKIKTTLVHYKSYTKTKPTHIQKNIYQFFLHMRKLPTTAQKDLINERTKIITEIIASHTFTCLVQYLYIYHQYVMKGSNRRESLCHHTVVNISRILRYIIDYHITHHVSLQRSLLHSDVPVSYSS